MNKSMIICPGCGWIGTQLLVYNTGQCPECDYKNADNPLLTIDEIINNKVIHDGVRLDLFLRSLFKLMEIKL